jgi:hypothetical protein
MMSRIPGAMKSILRKNIAASLSVMYGSIYYGPFCPVQLHVVSTLKSKNAKMMIQHQQIRWFPAKVKYSLKGLGPGGNMLKICFCYNDHDLYAKPKTKNHEQYQYVKSRCKLDEIKEKTKEEFETCKDLEYYDGEKEEWLPLTTTKDIASWKGGMKVLNIRVPSRWDDFIHENDIKGPDNDDDDDTVFRGPRDMKAAIEALILTCKLTDMTRSKVKPFHLQCGKKEISTKQWILNEAENDKLLRSIILQQPGTLDHVVQCLHLDIAWRKFKHIDPKADPSRQNEVQFGTISRSFSV